MPNFARINQTDGTADYANVVLWEAGEDGEDYGETTVGICEDYYTLTSNIQFRDGFVNGFRLEALAGQESKRSDITFGAGFGGAFNIDIRVEDAHFQQLLLELNIVNTTGNSSQRAVYTDCTIIGMLSTSSLRNASLTNTLVIDTGPVYVVDAWFDPNSLTNCSIVNLTGGTTSSIRARNAVAVLDCYDSCFFALGSGLSMTVLNGGTFTGDYNATHQATNAPGANAITNMSRVLADVFTDPAGNDYTPKVGGVLDGNSSVGGFIGAVDSTGGVGLTINLPIIGSTLVTQEPTLTKDLIISPPHLVSTIVFHTPTVAQEKNVSLSAIASTLNIHTLTVLKEQLISLSHITSTTIVENPVFLQDILITLERINSTLTFGDLTFLQDKTIELNRIISSLSVKQPTVTGGFREVPKIKIFTAEGYGTHVRTTKEMHKLIYELQDRIKQLELGD